MQNIFLEISFYTSYVQNIIDISYYYIINIQNRKNHLDSVIVHR